MSDPNAEIDQFLNELRESGVVSMFGAGPYLQDEFEFMSRQEAREHVSRWMKEFKA